MLNNIEIIGRYNYSQKINGEYLAETEISYNDIRMCFAVTAEVKEI